jgi:hypothetical protein
MKAMQRWTVEILVGEDEGVTYAEASLREDIGNKLRGKGRPGCTGGAGRSRDRRRNRCGAGADGLGHRLLIIASEDLRTVTNEPVRLSNRPLGLAHLVGLVALPIRYAVPQAEGRQGLRWSPWARS